MLTQIEISNLRGIAHGVLEDLTPLVILTGPNASGKSTVLDAMLIGLNPTGDSVGRSIRRRALWSGSRWLFHRPQTNTTARVVIGAEPRIEVSLDFTETVPAGLADKLTARPGPFTSVGGTVSATTSAHGYAETWSFVASVAADNYYAFWAFDHEVLGSDLPDEPARGADDIRVGAPSLRAARARLVEPTSRPALDQLFTAVSEIGRRRFVRDLLADVVPGLCDILLLSDAGSRPVLHLEFEDVSIPLAVAGDGVYMLARLALELAARPDGVILIEEPEIHLHPAAIQLAATVLWSAVKRGIQVVLSTHSLEFIDAVIERAPDGEIAKLSLVNLRLHGGQLLTSTTTGSDVKFARERIEADLR